MPGSGRQPGSGASDPNGQGPGENANADPKAAGGNRPGRTPDGRGRPGDNDPGSNNFKDETQPLPPPTAKPPANPGESIAPEVPQSDLVLRKIQDLLKDDKFTPDVEKQLGISKDEAEQFVKKFEKRKDPPAPAGPGREIKATPGQDKVFAPNRKAPEFNTQATVSNRNQRSGASIPQDNLSGLSEGSRSQPPPELRKQFEAYKRSVSRSSPKAVTPPAAGASPPGR